MQNHNWFCTQKLLKLRALRTQDNCNERLPLVRARLEELKEIFDSVMSGTISARSNMHPGVQIIIGTSNMYVYEDIDHVTFKREHGEIVFTSFAN